MKKTRLKISFLLLDLLGKIEAGDKNNAYG